MNLVSRGLTMLEVFGTTEDCGAEFRSNPLYVCEEI